MQEQKQRFSYQFWKPSKEKKENLSKNTVEPTLDVFDINSDSSKKFKNLLPKLSFDLEIFFNDFLNFENVKIEFNNYYDSLEISFKRDEKHLKYLRESSSEYKFQIAMKWEIMQISVEFKNLYKFLGIMGEQFNFQNSEDLSKFLQPNTIKHSFLNNSKLFSSDRENVSPSRRSSKKIEVVDYSSTESAKSSTDSLTIERQSPNFVSAKA